MTTKSRHSRTQRIWYGHGSSRLVADTAPDSPPVEAIDEAIAGFLCAAPSARSTTEPQSLADRHAAMHSLVADLSSQLAALDRQREHLARLLSEINNATLAT